MVYLSYLFSQTNIERVLKKKIQRYRSLLHYTDPRCASNDFHKGPGRIVFDTLAQHWDTLAAELQNQAQEHRKLLEDLSNSFSSDAGKRLEVRLEEHSTWCEENHKAAKQTSNYLRRIADAFERMKSVIPPWEELKPKYDTLEKISRSSDSMTAGAAYMHRLMLEEELNELQLEIKTAYRQYENAVIEEAKMIEEFMLPPRPPALHNYAHSDPLVKPELDRSKPSDTEEHMFGNKWTQLFSQDNHVPQSEQREVEVRVNSITQNSNSAGDREHLDWDRGEPLPWYMWGHAAIIPWNINYESRINQEWNIERRINQ